MPKFLIEVPHGEGKEECERAVRVFLETGSHFLSHAEWGCMDGDHRACLMVELDSKDEALGVVPTVYRNDAKITEVVHFKLDGQGAIAAAHPE